jgi:hypothetical protein
MDNSHLAAYENAVALAHAALIAALLAEFESATAYAAAISRAQSAGLGGDIGVALAHAITQVEFAQRHRRDAHAWHETCKHAKARYEEAANGPA